MSNTILVGYATRYGSTHEVAEAIADTLREAGLAVDVRLLREARTLDGYGAIVMGAPLFMFHWHKEAHEFLSRHKKALAERPAAVFVLGPVHEPHDAQEWTDSQAQLDKELAKHPWFKPVALEMFGGKYDPEKLGFPLKMFAGSEPASDIRDWEVIRLWASGLAKKLQPA